MAEAGECDRFSSMSFQDYLKTSAIEINQELEKFLDSWNREVDIVSPRLLPLAKTFIEASQGGKRLRGALVKFGYELTGKEFTPEILKASVGFEIFQTAILAHDDVVDLSPLRRGKPTIYKALGGDHYAISQTICLGDIGYFLAVRIISESSFSDENKSRALAFFSQAMIDTALGQMLDIELPCSRDVKEERDALTVFRLKTARYTITGPLQLGSILASCDKTFCDNITEFGESLGVAFQIQDDILGVFGNEAEMGKSVTSDIEEGKNTLLMIHALKNANHQQKQILEQYYGKGKIGVEELEKIRKVFIDTGALEYSQKKAEQLVNESKQVIKQMAVPADKKQMLIQMADFLVNRDN